MATEPRSQSVTVLAALSVCLLAASSPLEAPRVYYGQPNGAHTPSQIAASRVFDRIAEYQEIRDRHLSQDDPEYWILLDRANRKFYRAVGDTARGRGRDCVVETGTHEWGTIPDDTQAVIDALE